MEREDGDENDRERRGTGMTEHSFREGEEHAEEEESRLSRALEGAL